MPKSKIPPTLLVKDFLYRWILEDEDYITIKIFKDKDYKFAEVFYTKEEACDKFGNESVNCFNFVGCGLVHIFIF